MAYDGGDERGLPAWDRNLLDLGAPYVMDTATFIEWLERQLETPEETEKRQQAREDRHREWHRTAIGIYSCCITWGKIQFNPIRSVYEIREM